MLSPICNHLKKYIKFGYIYANCVCSIGFGIGFESAVSSCGSFVAICWMNVKSASFLEKCTFFASLNVAFISMYVCV